MPVILPSAMKCLVDSVDHLTLKRVNRLSPTALATARITVTVPKALVWPHPSVFAQACLGAADACGQDTEDLEGDLRHVQNQILEARAVERQQPRVA